MSEAHTGQAARVIGASTRRGGIKRAVSLGAGIGAGIGAGMACGEDDTGLPAAPSDDQRAMPPQAPGALTAACTRPRPC